MLLYASRPVRRRPAQPVKEIHSFKKCNVNTLLTHLQEAPWGVMDVFISIDDKWDYWKTLFMRITNEDGLCIMVMQIKNRVDSYAW